MHTSFKNDFPIRLQDISQRRVLKEFFLLMQSEDDAVSFHLSLMK